MDPIIAPYLDFLRLEDKMTEEQKWLVANTRRFAEKELEPIVAACFAQETFPEAMPRAMGALGLLGSNLGGYGLPGLDSLSYGLVMKEIERVDSGFRSFASVQGALVMYPIHAFGSEEQKSHWLPLLASGAAVGCFGLTESDGGSDPAAMKTRAVKHGDGWKLNGAKMWITNAVR